MIRRITLVNFMSHRNTVIEPADGLTILVGQNNCGKSAIVSALQILSGNATGDYMVRHGERECVVTVETDDGHVIEWRRKGSTVSYRLNGRDVHRLQGSVPDELHKLLRLPSVKSEGGDFDIHFAEQKEPIFLLNAPSSRRATFFASSSDAVKLIEMQNVHRRRIQEARLRETDLVKREDKLKARLGALVSVDELAGQITDLEQCYEAIQNEVLAAADLRELIRLTKSTAADFESWKAEVDALSPISAPPALESTTDLSNLIQGIDGKTTDLVRCEDAIMAMAVLSAPPEILDTSSIKGLVSGLVSVQHEMELNGERASKCASLREPPELANTVVLGEAIEELAAKGELLEAIREQAASLAGVLAPPVMDNIEQLVELIDSHEFLSSTAKGQRSYVAVLGGLEPPLAPLTLEGLKSTVSRLDELKESIDASELELQQDREALADVEHDLRHLVEELDACPLCGQEVGAEQLVTTSLFRTGRKH